MTSLIIAGLAQTALGRSLFARDIRDMRVGSMSAAWPQHLKKKGPKVPKGTIIANVLPLFCVAKDQFWSVSIDTCFGV